MPLSRPKGHEQVLGGGRLGGYHLLPHVTTTRLGYTLERLLLPMMHDLFKAIPHLGRMILLLVQLPLSVIELGRKDVGVILHLRHVLP